MLLLLVLPLPARAGAWTQGEDRWEVIANLVLSEADRGFGSAAPVSFRRALLQTRAEYGLRRNLTLFAATESAYVEVGTGASAYHETDNAFEGGARWRFDSWLGLSDLGVLALEASVRTAGAFNFAVSANRGAGGNGAELRLLYGRGFKLWRRDAFLDMAVGGRLLTGARPQETPVDITAGIWLNADNMVMAQSFNLFAPAGRLAAYPAFNSHKLQLSWVRRASRHFLIQTGGFFSPVGNNALVEQGITLSLWSRF